MGARTHEHDGWDYRTSVSGIVPRRAHSHAPTRVRVTPKEGRIMNECAFCTAPAQARVRISGMCTSGIDGDAACKCFTLDLCAADAVEIGEGALGGAYAMGMLTEDSPIQSWDALVESVKS